MGEGSLRYAKSLINSPGTVSREGGEGEQTSSSVQERGGTRDGIGIGEKVGKRFVSTFVEEPMGSLGKDRGRKGPTPVWTGKERGNQIQDPYRLEESLEGHDGFRGGRDSVDTKYQNPGLNRTDPGVPWFPRV